MPLAHGTLPNDESVTHDTLRRDDLVFRSDETELEPDRLVLSLDRAEKLVVEAFGLESLCYSKIWSEQ